VCVFVRVIIDLLRIRSVIERMGNEAMCKLSVSPACPVYIWETQTAGRQAVRKQSRRGSKSANCELRDHGDCRARSQNCEKRQLGFIMSARMEQFGSHSTDFHEI
jgi:hypothetical protein